MPKNKYYAVRIGRSPGIYSSWDECLEQINNYPKARFKKFNTCEMAQNFVNGIEESYEKRQAIKQKFERKRNNKFEKKQVALSIIKDRINDNNRIVCFTDGACEFNGSSNARAGIGVLWNNNEYKNLTEKLPGEIQTNNRAEIYAIIRALETCQDNEKILDIMTDSEYIVNAHNLWMEKWVKNNWMRGSEPIKNRDLFERMEELIKLRGNVIFTHVPSHSGIIGNERVDQLANRGIDVLENETFL